MNAVSTLNNHYNIGTNYFGEIFMDFKIEIASLIAEKAGISVEECAG